MIQVTIVYIASTLVALLMMAISLVDPELKDRHAGWKNPCTKRSHTELLEVTKSMGI